MDDEKIKCVVVNRRKEDAQRLDTLLQQIGLTRTLSIVSSPINRINIIVNGKPDLVFVYIERDGPQVFKIIEEIRQNGLNPEFIIIADDKDYTKQAVKGRVFDYLLKPIDVCELKESLMRFTRHKIHQKEVRYC